MSTQSGCARGMWKGAAPHWMVYFATAETDATVRKAEGAGGKVLVPPTDIPTVGRFARYAYVNTDQVYQMVAEALSNDFAPV